MGHVDGVGRVERSGVGAERHPRERDFFANVVHRHAEVNALDAAVILEHEVDDGVLRRLAPDASRLGDGFAHEFFAQLLVLEPDHHDAFRRLVGELLAQVAEQPLARLGFTHAVHPRLVPALLHPRRDHASQAGGTGVVCVHVGGDLQAVLLRLLNTPDQLVELVPIPPARRLEVINLRPDTGLACDVEQLVERLE